MNFISSNVHPYDQKGRKTASSFFRCIGTISPRIGRKRVFLDIFHDNAARCGRMNHEIAGKHDAHMGYAAACIKVEEDQVARKYLICAHVHETGRNNQIGRRPWNRNTLTLEDFADISRAIETLRPLSPETVRLATKEKCCGDDRTTKRVQCGRVYTYRVDIGLPPRYSFVVTTDRGT
jgi:hypothetical protein